MRVVYGLGNIQDQTHGLTSDFCSEAMNLCGALYPHVKLTEISNEFQLISVSSQTHWTRTEQKVEGLKSSFFDTISRNTLSNVVTSHKTWWSIFDWAESIIFVAWKNKIFSLKKCRKVTIKLRAVDLRLCQILMHAAFDWNDAMGTLNHHTKCDGLFLLPRALPSKSIPANNLR